MTHRILRSLIAFVILAALVVGVPVLLVRFGHWPLTQIPSGHAVRHAVTQPIGDAGILAAFTVAAWATWAVLVLTVLVELVAELRGGSGIRLPLPAPLQIGARSLVAALLMTVTVVGPAAAGRTAHAAAVSVPPLARAAVASQVLADAPAPPEAVNTSVEPPSAPIAPPTSPPSPTKKSQALTVSPGDSPWSLAERHLGSGFRWTELWDLNHGAAQPDGSAWVVEDLIQPGWILDLPPDAAPQVAAATPTSKSVAPAVDPAPPSTYVVAPGDTLSEIAATQLGDASRFPELFDASTRLDQPDAQHLTDPNLILPGWTIDIPGVAPEAVQGADPPIDPEPVHDDAQAPPPAPAPPTSGPQSVPSTSPPPARAVPPAIPAPRSSRALSPDASAPAPGPTPRSPSTTPGHDLIPAPSGPALAGVTGATVLATGLGLILRRRRRRQHNRGLPLTSTQTSPKLVETEAAIARASDVPLIRWAGQALATLVAEMNPRRVSGAPVAVELSESAGIELLWDVPQPDAPLPWAAADGGWAWRLTYDPDAPVPPDELPSPLPALVTIGIRDNRQLLFDLEGAGSVSVTGDPEAVDEFLRAIALELGAADDLADSYVTATGVEIDGLDHLPRITAGDSDEALHQLTATCRSVSDALHDSRLTSTFTYRTGHRANSLATVVAVAQVADESIREALATAAQPRRGIAAVVGGECSGALAHITIGADRRAHIDPLGIDFRAAGVSEDTASAFRAVIDADTEAGDPLLTSLPDPELAAVAEADPAKAVPTLQVPLDAPGDVILDLTDSRGGDATNGANGHLTSVSTAEPSRLVEVEVEPVGLPEPLLLVKVLGAPSVPDRPTLSRREIILTALLACRGTPLNRSTVQEAIWPGKQIDPKTVGNFVGGTRTSLGFLIDDIKVLPDADKQLSKLTIADGVVTDLAILRAAVEQAATASSGQAIKLLRTGLDLVEGPPFDGDGYDWAFYTYQYVAEAATLIETAALQLVELASAHDDLNAARWAMRQALCALPGNEPIYRARMTLEFEAGNLLAVAAAYQEVLRYNHDLDDEPSEATTDLFNRLSTVAGRLG